MSVQAAPGVRPATGFAPAARGYSGSIRKPSEVWLVSRFSNDAPLSAASTSLRHSAWLVGGNSAARGRSSSIGAKCHSHCGAAIELKQITCPPYLSFRGADEVREPGIQT